MLANIPMLFMLAGLAAYTVLSGADFGTGFWILFSDDEHRALRDHARHAMGPVWEANHVWLIFVLVVCWTAYPVAFASIVSTLTLPLFIAAIGIILRGAAYALGGQTVSPRQQLHIERVFALSSMLTPFAMGTAVGAIASGRVPVGNAAGNLLTSWLNPTSALIGTLAVAVSSYLAAVYLAADAHRTGDQELEHGFRVRALAAGIVTGAIAMLGLLVLRFDARSIWSGLTHGFGLLMIGLSIVAGLGMFFFGRRRDYGAARLSAALAVASIMFGWAIAQSPQILPGLTVAQAAAGPSTLVAVILCVAAGAIVLVPSLLLLFGLLLRGRLDAGADGASILLEPSTSISTRRLRARLIGGVVVTCLLLGAGATAFADGWMQAVGICCMCAAALPAFLLAATMQWSPEDEGIGVPANPRKSIN